MIDIPIPPGADPARETYPIQAIAHSHPRKHASVNRHTYLAAYEVYSAVYDPQEAMLKEGCRGGFGTGELIAFLYARAFPRNEWGKRVEQAFKDMDIK